MSDQALLQIKDNLQAYIADPANEAIYNAVFALSQTVQQRSFDELKDFFFLGKLVGGQVDEIGGSGGSGPGGKFAGKDFFPFFEDQDLDATAKTVLELAHEKYVADFNITFGLRPGMVPYVYDEFWPALYQDESIATNLTTFNCFIIYTERVKDRLLSFIGPPGNTAEQTAAQERLEREQFIEDIYSSSEWQALSIFLAASIGNQSALPPPGAGNYIQGSLDVFERAIIQGNADIPKTEEGYAQIVYPLIYSLNTTSLASIQDESTAAALVATMESLGLLELLLYADQIKDFAERRLASRETVTGPVADILQGPTNSVGDLLWYSKLAEVFRNVKSNPVGFATINYYFPGLTTFFINVISIVSDFSNNGRGGDEEDPANNAEELIDSLERAFGIDENGEPVFELAFRFENTAQRIRQAIINSPFRENLPPTSPQIYGFRLGAANFYVPPLSININTQFKTGSLTGGAIRQQNSPKFNSGYKETTISLQLFFPNYEEIWGVSIDPSTTIALDQDFQIDFKKDGSTEKEIDKFLSSLRGLIAAFKYSPILPVRNHYLNSVHGVTAVALSNMSISTVPNYPFSLMVQIELLNFNHKPFLPMISDFNQAIHWGKYRHYMGNAAGRMHAYVNEGFLLKESDLKDSNNNVSDDDDPQMPEIQPNLTYPADALALDVIGEDNTETVSNTESLARYSDQVMRTNVINEWLSGNNISFYLPAETQTKIFLPDTASFRTEQEKIILEVGLPFWERQLEKIGLDMQGEYVRPLSTTIDLSRNRTYSISVRNSLKRLVDFITAGFDEETTQRQVYAFLVEEFLLENERRLDVNAQLRREKVEWLQNFDAPRLRYPDEQEFFFDGELREVSLDDVKATIKAGSENVQDLIDSLIDQQIQREGLVGQNEIDARREQLKNQYIDAFNVLVYDRVFASGPIQQLMAANQYRNAGYQLREWEVPMIRVDMDPENVIVTGVSVSLGNNFASLQVQMMDEPTYQHIGGRDTFINISMVIRGEKELLKFKRVFDHINNLARLEHAAGIIGFLGIKNVICALSGVKYVMPLNYSVNTIPNFPHYYIVELSLVDFDVFQQKREELSSKQQRELVEHFGSKKNPFLRIKQLWSSTNTYPDFPLSVVDADNEVVGHLDPDFYFRSFEMFDQDVVKNISNQEQRVQTSSIARQSENPDAALRLVQEFVNSYFKIVDRSQSQEVYENSVNTLVENFTAQISSLGVSRRELTQYINDVLDQKYGEERDFSSLLQMVDTQIQELAVDAVGYDLDEEILKFLQAVDFATQESSSDSTFDTRIDRALGRFDILGVSRDSVASIILDEYFGDVISTGLLEDFGDLSNGTFTPELKTLVLERIRATDQESYIVNNLGVSRQFGSAEIGDIQSGSAELANYINQIMTTSSLEGEDEVSISVDDDRFHKLITRIPLPSEDGEIPAIMNTAAGHFTGYIKNGRFYLTVDGRSVQVGASNLDLYLRFKDLFDPQSPTIGTTNTLSGVPGTVPLSDYANPYSGKKINKQFTEVRRHWENMFVDTSYRDISGRMLRAFPTYMLWLIDEGGYFAGVKMFDNFYGLQSIIDFSVVSSEDLLGDTLILRVSNLYSKLTLPENTSIFNPGIEGLGPQDVSLGQGIESVLDSTLNKARNIMSGLKNSYIVDIKNIRLKPGVRVHLRAGYGSNPNSLQTIFNGIITEVQTGEIVTVTAQSDAIELGAIVNSTNSKGHSGSIDGGLDTGLWLSEPRDLMVRLLSMGTSRFKEGISWATRGIVFSENKFGIRHFGSVLYPPLNSQEQVKHQQLQQNLANAYTTLGNFNGGDAAGLAGQAAITGLLTMPVGMPIGMLSGGLTSRGQSAFRMISQIWSNFGARRDLEIFKRNIYPGNGTGLAQFLGGDLDDGWASIASYDEESVYSDRVEGYLERNTELVWNRLVEFSQSEQNTAANATLENLTSQNELVANQGTGFLDSALQNLGGVLGTVSLAGSTVGWDIGKNVARGLTGILRGRGGGFTNIFRVLGVISPNDDDDIAGFDEVSFRAQTYMRTVWDLFKVCARMLPNYIVAVRPFEDRSTIFYGKPHWVYTSGVVPVTTGMPGDRDIEIEEPDQDFNDMMKALSIESSELLDYDAYIQASKPQVNMTTMIEAQLSSAGEYAPTRYFSGKVINFADRPSLYSGPNEECMLPAMKGVVEVGLHLPVDLGSGRRTIVPLSENLGHKQINQLPPRYRYPFFNSLTTEPTVSGESESTTWFATIYSSSFYQESDTGGIGGKRADRDEPAASILVNLGPVDIGGGQSDANLAKEFRYLYFGTSSLESENSQNRDTGEAIYHRLRDLEVNFGQSIRPSSGPVSFDTSPINFSSLDDQNPDRETVLSSGHYIRMPFPQKAGSAFDYEDARDYDTEDYWSNEETTLNKSVDERFGSTVVNYKPYEEWGSPSTYEDEQFYIAMRWPYRPSTFDLEYFKEMYFKSADEYQIPWLDYDDLELTGQAADYKRRKVLVYNPALKRAVVCRPAYFMWGEKEGHWRLENDAIVSPDAAFHLGLLTSENVYDFRDNGNVSKTPEVYDSGFTHFPYRQECFFAFVPDDIPVGVVSSVVAPAQEFELENQADGTNVNNLEDFLIGFGNFQSNTGNFFAKKTQRAVSGSPDRNRPNSLNTYVTSDDVTLLDAQQVSQANIYGGNPLADGGNRVSYIQMVVDGLYGEITNDSLKTVLEDEINPDGSRNRRGLEWLPSVGDRQWAVFSAVYDPLDQVSVEARSFYDENYSAEVATITGRGRTLLQAQEIWDQFRVGYHNYESVKNIFKQFYNLDPDSEEEFPEFFQTIFEANNQNPDPAISKYSDNLGRPSGGYASDEFSVIFGADWYDRVRSSQDYDESRREAIEFVRRNLIDDVPNPNDLSLIEYLNKIIYDSLIKLRDIFLVNQTTLNMLSNSIYGPPSGSAGSSNSPSTGGSTTGSTGTATSGSTGTTTGGTSGGTTGGGPSSTMQ